MNGEDERIWQHRVDERLVDLTTAQKVTNDHLDQIDETLDALDRTIRGDYEKDRDGIVARLENMERSVSQFHAVLFQDSTGKKGLVHTIDLILSGKAERRERSQHITSIAIAVITSTALVLTNLDKISDFWVRTFGKSGGSDLEKTIERGKHPHVRKIVPRRVIDYGSPPAQGE